MQLIENFYVGPTGAGGVQVKLRNGHPEEDVIPLHLKLVEYFKSLQDQDPSITPKRLDLKFWGKEYTVIELNIKHYRLTNLSDGEEITFEIVDGSTSGLPTTTAQLGHKMLIALQGHGHPDALGVKFSRRGTPYLMEEIDV